MKLVYEVHLFYKQDDVIPCIGNLKEEKPCVPMFQTIPLPTRMLLPKMIKYVGFIELNSCPG